MAARVNVSAPHVPTLIYAVLGALVLLFLYHATIGHRR